MTQWADDKPKFLLQGVMRYIDYRLHCLFFFCSVFILLTLEETFLKCRLAIYCTSKQFKVATYNMIFSTWWMESTLFCVVTDVFMYQSFVSSKMSVHELFTLLQ